MFQKKTKDERNAECKMQNAECKMQNAECKMQNAKFRIAFSSQLSTLNSQRPFLKCFGLKFG